MIPTKLRRAVKQALGRLYRRTTPKLTSHPDVPSMLIAHNKHGAYCLPRSSLHRPASQAILQGRVWEEETIMFMCANRGGGDVIHAGTYFGDFLPALSKSLARGNKIWAFEPVAENYRCARSTIALNNLDNVELRQAALGPSPGTIGFVTVDERGRALGGGSHFDSTGGTETVAQVALDDVVPLGRPVSVIQLDVEGYEGGALRGAQEIIRRNRPIIILETVPSGFTDVYDYVYVRRLNENSVFRPR